MRVDEASAVVPASPQDAFRAFVDPELLCRWLPPAGMSGTMERFDPVAGGGFRMTLTYARPEEARGKFSEDSDVSEVRIDRLEPGRQVVWKIDFPSDDPAFAGTMTMTWSLERDRGGTLVSVRAADVPDGIDPADHRAGLTSSLENLMALLRPE